MLGLEDDLFVYNSQITNCLDKLRDYIRKYDHNHVQALQLVLIRNIIPQTLNKSILLAFRVIIPCEL